MAGLVLTDELRARIEDITARTWEDIEGSLLRDPRASWDLITDPDWIAASRWMRALVYSIIAHALIVKELVAMWPGLVGHATDEVHTRELLDALWELSPAQHGPDHAAFLKLQDEVFTEISTLRIAMDENPHLDLRNWKQADGTDLAEELVAKESQIVTRLEDAGLAQEMQQSLMNRVQWPALDVAEALLAEG